MYICTYICTTALTNQEVVRVEEKERRRRLPPGTLVIGTCQFVGEEDGVSKSLYHVSVVLLSQMYVHAVVLANRHGLILNLTVNLHVLRYSHNTWKCCSTYVHASPALKQYIHVSAIEYSCIWCPVYVAHMHSYHSISYLLSVLHSPREKLLSFNIGKNMESNCLECYAIHPLSSPRHG